MSNKNDNFMPMNSVQNVKNRRVVGGVMSVVLSEKNGKRLVFSKELIDELCVEDELYIMHNGKSIMLSSEPLLGCPEPFILRAYSADRKVLYCADLVKEVAKILDLDFTDCVCRTLTNVEYNEDQASGNVLAIIGREEHDEGGDNNEVE